MANMQTKATFTVPKLKRESEIDVTQLEIAAEVFNLINNCDKGSNMINNAEMQKISKNCNHTGTVC